MTISSSTPSPQDPTLYAQPGAPQTSQGTEKPRGKEGHEKPHQQTHTTHSGTSDASHQETTINQDHETHQHQQDDEGGSGGGGGGGTGGGDNSSGGGDSSSSGGDGFSQGGGQLTTLEDFVELGGPVTSSTSVTSITHFYHTDQISSSADGLKALSVESNTKWSSDVPQLPRAGAVNPLAVKAAMSGNLWFNSFFLTDLTVNLFKIVQSSKKQRQLDGQLMAKSMLATLALGESIGQAIMNKAQKEQAQYTALAISAAVSFAVSCVGFAMSMKGILKAGRAKAAKLEGEEADETQFKGGGTQDVAKGSGKSTPVEEFTTQKKAVNAAETKQAESAEMKQEQERAKTAAEQRKTRQQNINRLKLESQKLSSIGQFLTGVTRHLGDIMDNSIRAGFAIPIAKEEQQRVLLEAYKQVMTQAYESYSKSFSDLAQVIDSAIQALQKIQDENARAHNLQRG